MNEPTQAITVVERPTQSSTIGALAEALAAAQGAFPTVLKANRVTVMAKSGGVLYRTRYADLAAVVEACRGPLATNKLAVVQDLDANGHSVTVRTIILHASGEWRECGTVHLTPASEGAQAVGSAITYARRYGYCAALSVVADEDDDANAADGQVAEPEGEGRDVAETLAEQAGPRSPYWCAEHKAVWFKKGKMHQYAHPIGDTGQWCNMPAEKPATEPLPAPTQPQPAAKVPPTEDLGVCKVHNVPWRRGKDGSLGHSQGKDVNGKVIVCRPPMTDAQKQIIATLQVDAGLEPSDVVGMCRTLFSREYEQLNVLEATKLIAELGEKDMKND